MSEEKQPQPPRNNQLLVIRLLGKSDALIELTNQLTKQTECLLKEIDRLEKLETFGPEKKDG